MRGHNPSLPENWTKFYAADADIGIPMFCFLLATDETTRVMMVFYFAFFFCVANGTKIPVSRKMFYKTAKQKIQEYLFNIRTVLNVRDSSFIPHIVISVSKYKTTHFDLTENSEKRYFMSLLLSHLLTISCKRYMVYPKVLKHWDT